MIARKHKTKQTLLGVVSGFAVMLLAGARPSDTPLEVDVDSRLVMLAACDFKPCEDKKDHWCVDLETKPYEWHSGCYPPTGES